MGLGNGASDFVSLGLHMVVDDDWEAVGTSVSLRVAVDSGR